MERTATYLGFFKPSILILIIIFPSIGLYVLTTSFGFSISIAAVITFLLGIVSKYLWNRKAFNWMFKFEDISGTYEGVINHSRIEDGELMKGELRHVKVINQTGYRLSVSSFTYKEDGTPSSSSENKVMSIEKTEDESQYKLIYTYENEGSEEQGFPSHNGTEILKVITDRENNKTLSGRYFTNRTPQTKGYFSDMKWISKDTTHKF